MNQKLSYTEPYHFRQLIFRIAGSEAATGGRGKNSVKNFEVRADVPIADVEADQVQIKVSACGVCGTDRYSVGEFLTKFPFIPGHEIVGTISSIGTSVKDFKSGDRCVLDPVVTCGNCFYCRRGKSLFCENFDGLGATLPGGFADYVTVASNKVHHIYSLTDEEATLIEPAACAVHGADKLGLPVGSEVLILGAGPTGLILAQLLKLNGASKVVVAAHKGVKMDVARKLHAADEYLKKNYVYGFDAVASSPGLILTRISLLKVRRGLCAHDARVNWALSKILGDEIRIIGSFAQTFCFPRAVAYLDSGKIRVKGMATDTFTVNEYQKALDKLESRTAFKIVIKPTGSVQLQ
ncbi:chaperonin 10-like protein [Mycena rebaudengoi]|nr:chaperonin 10-like protein [Mycena rebaudengoi]